MEEATFIISISSVCIFLWWFSRLLTKVKVNKTKVSFERLRAEERKLRKKQYRRKWDPKICDFMLVKDHKQSSFHQMMIP